MGNFLKPDKRKEKIKQWYVWDIETFHDNKDVRGIGCYHLINDDYRYFETFDAFFAFMKNRIGAIFYSHFGGRFDMLYFLQWLDKQEKKYPINFIMSGSRIITMRITVKSNVAIRNKKVYIVNRYVNLWDSFSYFGKKLDGLLKDFNLLDKESFNVDYTKFDNDEYWETIGKPYLKNDCIGLAKLLQYFFDKITSINGKVRPTLASCSVSLYRSRFLTHNIVRNAEYNEYMRNGYIGGRTEVILHKGNNINLYDINSLYPYVMQNNVFPIGTMKTSDAFSRHSNKYCSFVLAHVTVKDNVFFPVLPYRDREKKKVLFPIGEFYGLFSYPEFITAIDDNQLDDYEVYKQFYFPAGNIFNDYVSILYEYRQKSSNEFERYIWKIFMNSLYGKFCQNPEKQIFHISPAKYDNLVPYIPDKNIWIEKVNKDSNFIIVPIGAMITAYARLELYRKIRDLLSKGYLVYYCDTDSIYTNAPESEFNISMELGAWKVENKFEYMEFHFPKCYKGKTIDGKWIIKSKGIRLDNEQFDRYILGEKIAQNDIVKVSPIKRALKSYGEYVGYLPIEKSSHNPLPKRMEYGPIKILERKMPECLKILK